MGHKYTIWCMDALAHDLIVTIHQSRARVHDSSEGLWKLTGRINLTENLRKEMSDQILIQLIVKDWVSECYSIYH